MSTKDQVAKLFFEKTSHAAQLCNIFFHGGKKVIKGDDLIEISPELNQVSTEKEGPPKADSRHRDLLFMSKVLMDGSPGTMLIGIEFQSYQDSLMVLRMAEYNIRLYLKEIRTEKRKEYGYLLPVASFVVNLGEKHWTSPCTLYKLFAQGPDYSKLGIDNFRIHLLELFDVDDNILQRCDTEVCLVLSCFKYQHEKEKLFELLKEYNGKLSIEGAQMLSEYLKISVQSKLIIGQNETEERVITMCDGWLAIKNELEKHGEERGIKLGEERGMEKGILKQKIETIINAINNKLTLETIMAVTGFSKEGLMKFIRENDIPL